MIEVIRDGLEEIKIGVIFAYVSALVVTALVLVMYNSFQIKTFVACSICVACILFVIVLATILVVGKYFEEW